jgi:general secretion pathway protein N
MTGFEKMLNRGMTLTALLLSAFALPASTSALPTAESASEIEAPRRTDRPSAPSLWEQPAPAAPVVVRAPASPPPPPEPVLSANPLWAIPLATLSNTRERPIFSASRRPPPVAVVPVTVARAPPPPKPARVERPQLALVGTISSGDASFGIFVDQSTKSALRLKIGEDYQGWRLRAVQGREVTLERDQQTTILSLPQPGTPAAGALRTQADNEPPTAEPPRRANRRQ